MLQTIFFTQRALKGHLGTQRVLQEHGKGTPRTSGHSKGFARALGHSKHLGTQALSTSVSVSKKWVALIPSLKFLSSEVLFNFL